MAKIRIGNTDYSLSDAQARALLILSDRWREGKRTSPGAVQARTLTSLVSMGLASAHGNVYATNYSPTATGRRVAAALRTAAEQ